MRKPTTRDYERRLAQLDRTEKTLDLKKQVENREKELGLRRTWKRPPWSKVIMAAMVLICLEIIIFSEVAMLELGDLSALYALVGVAASLAAAIWAYCEKSKAENTKGGIVYDSAMQKPEDNDTGDEDAAG
jgi:hypothetical protein